MNPYGKIVANKGVERNKRPLPNLVYKVDFIPPYNAPDMEKYKFKDEGYILLHYTDESELRERKALWRRHGYITPEDLKKKFGEKQWAKFCQGKRQFIIQRRINGKNIKKVKKEKV